jgi:hypothetical protein
MREERVLIPVSAEEMYGNAGAAGRDLVVGLGASRAIQLFVNFDGCCVYGMRLSHDDDLGEHNPPRGC